MSYDEWKKEVLERNKNLKPSEFAEAVSNIPIKGEIK